MKTRAAVLWSAGEPMVIQDVDLDPPKEEEVLVEIKATSVCHSDLNGARDAAGPLPVILGHEGAGVVAEVGKSVTHVKPGDKVVLSWLPYCGKCFYCQAGQVQLCETVIKPLFEGTLLDGTTRFSHQGKTIFHYSLGSTFSRHTVVPARACVKLPEEMPLDRACMIGCGVATGWGAAVSAMQIPRGGCVAVFGLGAVGLCAIQGARFAGAERVIAIDLKKQNLDKAFEFGATHTVDGSQPERVRQLAMELTQGRGVDASIDATGSVAACRLAFEIGRKGSTTVVVGAFGAKEITLPASGFHRLGKILKGSFYGDVDPIHGLRELADLYLGGQLKLDELIFRRTGLDRVNESLESFEDPNLANAGRWVIEFD